MHGNIIRRRLSGFGAAGAITLLVLSVILTSTAFYAGTAADARAVSGPITRADSDPPLEYIVLGPSEFAVSAKPLVDWKTKKGVPAKYKSTEDILVEFASAGKDDLHKIRQYLRSEYAAHPELKWVLILGDSDIIPIRDLFAGAEPYGLNTYPSDHYFSALNGTWDSDNNGVYGEDPQDEDWIPELYVGRLPVGTSAEVDAVVSKILGYERSPPSGDWYTSALVMGSLMDAPNVVDLPETTTDDEGYNEYKDNAFKVKKRSMDFFPPQYSFTELYDYDRMPPGDYALDNDTLTRENAVAEFNKGYALLNFAGQARFNGDSLMQYEYSDGTGTYQWHRFIAWRDLYRYEDAQQASNGGKLPLIMMPTCDAANFTEDDDTNLEKLLTASGGGAIGIISNTGESHRGESFDGGSYGNWWEDEQFWRIFFQQGVYRPGEALAELKVAFAQEILTSTDQHPTFFRKALKGNLEGLTLLGDPEVPIWTDVPGRLDAHVANLTTGRVIIEVSVMDHAEGTPVEGALVALSGSGLYVYGNTDHTGTVRFNVTVEQTGEIDITASAHNFLPLEEQLKIVLAPPKIRRIEDITIIEDFELQDHLNLHEIVSDADTEFTDLEFEVSTSPSMTGVAVDDLYNLDIKPDTNWNGIALVSLAVSDGVYTVYGNFTLTVTPVNDPPALRGLPAELLAWEDQLTIYGNISAYDPDSTRLRFSDSSTIFEINSTTGRISFIPAGVHAGEHRVCISVSDGIDTTTGCFTLKIFNIDNPPVIAEIERLNAEAGEEFHYRVLAYDDDGDNLTYSASPSWVKIDPATGEIAFTPGSGDVGTHRVKVTVSDETGSTTEDFELEVQAASDRRTLAIGMAFAAMVMIIIMGFLMFRQKKLQEYYQEKKKKAEEKPLKRPLKRAPQRVKKKS